MVLADHQNYYPDMSFVFIENPSIKYAVDIKTTYRKSDNKCNGFTLGSHGEYFIIKHFFPIIFKYSITINYILYFSNTSYISGITTTAFITCYFPMGLHWVHTVNILLIEHQVKIFSIHIMNIKPTIV